MKQANELWAGNSDARYFRRRAEEELRLAQESDNPAAVTAHYEMAERYLNRIHGGETAMAPDSSRACGTDQSRPDGREGPA